jgi:molecular chaperone DnaK
MRVGIDLGTTYSLITVLGHDGRPYLIPDSENSELFATPSVVSIAEGSAFVGQIVETLTENNPDLPVQRFFKRNFGIAKPLYFDKNNSSWYPEAMAALVLKKLKHDAESYANESIDGAVITVPAHFDDAQRRCVLNAAALADIPVLGLVEEPVAAALHYTITQKVYDKLVLVYDLGGGTFDSTLLSIDENGTYVLSKEGISDLGGKEFDEQIAAYIIEQFEKLTRQKLNLNAITLLQLRKLSEEVKIELSIPNLPTIKKTLFIDNQMIEIVFSRKHFESNISMAIDSTIEATIKCIQGANMRIEDVNTVLLVGGSSMIPYVREKLRSVFSKSDQSILFHEPMKAVAYGASIYAAQIAGDADVYNIPPEFIGITGYNIGIKTYNNDSKNEEIDTIIRKNLPLPVKATRTYYTSSNTQTNIRLQVVQFTDKKGEIHEVGTLNIGPIPNPKANYPIEVTLENTEDGIIQIVAYDPTTGIELEQTFGSEDGEDNYLTKQKRLVDKTLINTIPK